MRSVPVESFGRRAPEAPTPNVVLLPPIAMPGVQLPVQLVVDATSLAEASTVIQRMVADAVRAGLAEGISGEEPERPDPGTGPGVEHLTTLMR